MAQTTITRKDLLEEVNTRMLPRLEALLQTNLTETKLAQVSTAIKAMKSGHYKSETITCARTLCSFFNWTVKQSERLAMSKVCQRKKYQAEKVMKTKTKPEVKQEEGYSLSCNGTDNGLAVKVRGYVYQLQPLTKEKQEETKHMNIITSFQQEGTKCTDNTAKLYDAVDKATKTYLSALGLEMWNLQKKVNEMRDWYLRRVAYSLGIKLDHKEIID